MWFEAFPLVFGGVYHFNLGVSGLPFIGIVVGGILSFAFYCAFILYYVIPKSARDGMPPPEDRLKLAVASGILIPISLFIFGMSTIDFP